MSRLCEPRIYSSICTPRGVLSTDQVYRAVFAFTYIELYLDYVYRAGYATHVYRAVSADYVENAVSSDQVDRTICAECVNRTVDRVDKDERIEFFEENGSFPENFKGS